MPSNCAIAVEGGDGHAVEQTKMKIWLLKDLLTRPDVDIETAYKEHKNCLKPTDRKASTFVQDRLKAALSSAAGGSVSETQTFNGVFGSWTYDNGRSVPNRANHGFNFILINEGEGGSRLSFNDTTHSVVGYTCGEEDIFRCESDTALFRRNPDVEKNLKGVSGAPYTLIAVREGEKGHTVAYVTDIGRDLVGTVDPAWLKEGENAHVQEVE